MNVMRTVGRKLCDLARMPKAKADPSSEVEDLAALTTDLESTCRSLPMYLPWHLSYISDSMMPPENADDHLRLVVDWFSCQGPSKIPTVSPTPKDHIRIANS